MEFILYEAKHTTGHGNAISVSGWPALMGLDGMKKAQKS